MGMTNAQKRKQAKTKDRERRSRKAVNDRRNQASARFVLDVLMDGKWVEAKRFTSEAQLNGHIAETEASRRAGGEIVPGRVTHIASGKVVAEIAGSKAKGAVPDTIRDGAKADPNVTAKAPEVVAEFVEEVVDK